MAYTTQEAPRGIARSVTLRSLGNILAIAGVTLLVYAVVVGAFIVA